MQKIEEVAHVCQKFELVFIALIPENTHVTKKPYLHTTLHIKCYSLSTLQTLVYITFCMVYFSKDNCMSILLQRPSSLIN
jgi:hypothetical protein